MPDQLSILIILSFLCLMTGLFSPESIIKWGIPNLKYRKNILITLSVLTITAAVAYTNNEKDVMSEKVKAVSSTFEESLIVDEDQHHPSLTDDLGLGGVNVELLNVTTLSSENHGLLSEDAYLKVELQIENQSNEVMTYNPYQFLIENEGGQKFVPSINSLNLENSLGAGNLERGESVVGSLVYTYAKGEAPLNLQYIPIASQPSYSININLSTESVSVQDDFREADAFKASQTVAIGDIIKEEGIEYQVLSASRLHKLESSNPKNGSEYLKVELALKNTSDETLFVFPYHFEVQDEKNHMIKPVTSLIESEGLISLSEIVSGGVLQGTLLFEIPKQSTQLNLTYSNPLQFKTERTAVNLKTQHEPTESLMPNLVLNESWKIGDRLVPCELEGMQLTTYSFDFKTQTDYTQAKESRKFLVIDVALKNISEQVKKFTTFDFKLLSPTGQLLMPSLTLIDNKSEFKSGILDFEQETTGLLIFEVNEKDEKFSLIYSPSNWLHPEKVMIPLT